MNPAIRGNQELQRAAIQRERQIELATEGQRYFDVRRWMIADKNGEGRQNGYVHGMNVRGESNDKEDFNRIVEASQIVFNRKMCIRDRHYTAADLLNDGTFLDSMQHPTEQSEKFWSQLEKENETFAGELRMARSFLMAVAESPQKRMTDDEVGTLWERISQMCIRDRFIHLYDLINKFVFT